MRLERIGSTLWRGARKDHWYYKVAQKTNIIRCIDLIKNPSVPLCRTKVGIASSDVRLSRRATGKAVQNQLAFALREAGDRVVGRKVPPIWGPSRGSVDVGMEGR